MIKISENCKKKKNNIVLREHVDVDVLSILVLILCFLLKKHAILFIHIHKDVIFLGSVKM